MKKILILFLFASGIFRCYAEDGYSLWLRYDQVNDRILLEQYRALVTGIYVSGQSSTLNIATTELTTALSGLLGKKTGTRTSVVEGTVVLAKRSVDNKIIAASGVNYQLLGDEGFAIKTQVPLQQEPAYFDLLARLT